MKKSILTLFLAIMATVGLYAQQISVVSPGGSTALFKTLAEAINEAEGGSVIYLPGGGFPIADEVKISKKLTIIGIGHKNDNNNADGFTNISGNLFFIEGSSASAVMGCYISGKVDIGANVDEILIRYCNLNNVNVNSTCSGTSVNQCYVRSTSYFNNANGYFTNNIAYGLYRLNNGFIENNIFTTASIFGGTSGSCDGSSIMNNIIISKPSTTYVNNSCHVSGNMLITSWNMDPDAIVLDAEWKDVFKEFNGGAVSPSSDFHFSEAFKQYEGKVGIYSGGSDFDKQLAPVPYIVAKRVDTETDASGKLNVKIRVKAGQ